MRILCDHNVAGKYVETFQRTEWITVLTVSAALGPRADDAEISRFAATDESILFTSDDDFYTTEPTHGLLVYRQIEDPDPGELLDALEQIDAAYERPEDVTETVPGAWV